MSATPFSKYSGCGNDFILIDNRSSFFPVNNRPLIKKLCQRTEGIGADGLILLESSSVADFKMKIFNADGSEAEMCGNGIRCLLKFAREHGYLETQYKVETFERILQLEWKGDKIMVDMGDPTEVRWDIPLVIENQEIKLHHLNTGVPHAILFVENFQTIDLKVLGPLIRHHPIFAPKGANVNLAQIHSSNVVRLRTFERGVEEETLACGTGAVATALATSHKYGLKSPINIRTQSTEVLQIQFEISEGKYHDVKMIGPANETFRGEIHLT